jgi:hypothetical protein
MIAPFRLVLTGGYVVKLKKLAMYTAASFALLGAQNAFACATSAWGQGLGAGQGVQGTPVAGEPYVTGTNPTAVPRYSGRCGLQSDALGDFVQDGSPQGTSGTEQNYRVAFSVFTGPTTGSPVIFEALDDAGSPVTQIRVTYNAAGNFTFTTPAGSGTVSGVTPGRWYQVAFRWSSVSGSNSLSNVQVKGAGSSTVLAMAPTTLGVTAGAVIDRARLGWISGTASGGNVITDRFESRRNTDPGFLCRGDANADTVISGPDVIQARNESLGGSASMALGQPDANEDGVISGPDVITIRNLSLTTGCAGA